MTRQYLIGELSVRLEKLQAATAPGGAAQLAELRHSLESGPPLWLGAAVRRALVLADNLCWDSLVRGDAHAFIHQAAASAELYQFGVWASLIRDE